MSYEMPNPLNFTFQPYVVTIMIMLYYIPGFPPMYFHMFAQRKKVLGKAKEAWNIYLLHEILAFKKGLF